MAKKDACQTAMRGSGGHYNHLLFWHILAIGLIYEGFR
jgi:superoxide dismutase